MKNITITLPDEVMTLAKAKASTQCRSLSQHVSWLIQQDATAKARARRVSKEEVAQ